MGKNQKSTGASGRTPSFEDDLKRLEEIVALLEEGNLSLEQSLALYEEGVQAYTRCQKLLEEADAKVRKLVQTLEGELREEPFEPPESAREDEP